MKLAVVVGALSAGNLADGGRAQRSKYPMSCSTDVLATGLIRWSHRRRSQWRRAEGRQWSGDKAAADRRSRGQEPGQILDKSRGVHGHDRRGGRVVGGWGEFGRRARQAHAGSMQSERIGTSRMQRASVLPEREGCGSRGSADGVAMAPHSRGELSWKYDRREPGGLETVNCWVRQQRTGMEWRWVAISGIATELGRAGAVLPFAPSEAQHQR
jgi:hypothetical protein